MAARDAKVKRVVFAGSTAVYGDTPILPTNENTPRPRFLPMAHRNWRLKPMARFSGDPTGSNLSPSDTSTCSARARTPGRPIPVCCRGSMRRSGGTQPIVFGDGEQSRDFVYVGNVVEANLLACEAKDAAGLVINIGTGTRHTLNQTLASLEKITGRPAKARYAPPREGDIRDSQADITRARNVLGYNPRIGFEEGLKHTWEWFCASQGAPSRA